MVVPRLRRKSQQDSVSSNTMAKQPRELQVQERLVEENHSLRDYVIPLVKGIH